MRRSPRGGPATVGASLPGASPPSPRHPRPSPSSNTAASRAALRSPLPVLSSPSYGSHDPAPLDTHKLVGGADGSIPLSSSFVAPASPRGYAPFRDDDAAETDVEAEARAPAALPWTQRTRQHLYRFFCATRAGLLLFLVVSTILVSAFDWVMWKKTLNRFHSKTTDTTYTFFLLQVYVFLMLVCSGFAAIIQYSRPGVITPAMKEFPKRKFWIMSAFDTVAVLCSSMSGAAVAGHIQTLLSQLNLPLTMTFSALFLGTLYARPQLAGAALVLMGATLAAVPAAVDGGETAGRHNKTWGVVVYAIGAFPLSFSNVYREYLFRDRAKLDLFFLMFWTSLFQFLLGFLTLPVLAIPVFGGTSFEDMPHQFRLGWHCLIGRHVDELECEVGTRPVWFLLTYVGLNFVVSILRLLLIKHGSAVLLQVTNALALLFSNLIFCLPFVMGDDAEHFSPFDAAGLAIVLLGFLLFRLSAAAEDAKRDKEDMLAAAAAAGEGMGGGYNSSDDYDDDSTAAATGVRIGAGVGPGSGAAMGTVPGSGAGAGMVGSSIANSRSADGAAALLLASEEGRGHASAHAVGDESETDGTGTASPSPAATAATLAALAEDG